MKFKLFASHCMDTYIRKASGHTIYMPRMTRSEISHSIFIDPDDYVGYYIDLQGKRRPILRQKYALLFDDAVEDLKRHNATNEIAIKIQKIPQFLFSITQVKRVSSYDIQPFSHNSIALQLINEFKP